MSAREVINELTRAIKQKNLDRVKEIVEAGCDLSMDVIEYMVCGEDYGKLYYSILITAMKYSTLEICEYLVDNGAKFDIEDIQSGFSNKRDIKEQVRRFFNRS